MIARVLFSAACLAAFDIICLPTGCLRAQSPLTTKWDESSRRLSAPVEPLAPQFPVPAAVRGAVEKRRPIATFTFGNGQKITSRTPTSRFRLVSLHPGEIVDVALQFPAALPRNSAMAQSLDGGQLISFSKSDVEVGGFASIRFQAGHHPGLYRVFVLGFGEPLLLQFWVADSGNPKANPPVLNPAH